MHWKPMKLAALAILALVLAATPVLMGCGEKEPTEKKVIVVGSLAAFSGIAASAVVPTVGAFEDAILYYQEKTPIKGVEFQFPHYDHQLDYSKSKQGYEDLKAQGMNVFYCMGGTEKDALQSYFPEDKMPTIGNYGTTPTLSAGWIYNVTPTQTWGAEACMQWIEDTWDYSKGVPRVAHQGWSLATTKEIQEGIDNVLNAPAYSGKFTWEGLDKAAVGNAGWAAQCEKFKNCDYVFVSLVGNSLATFVSQMRSTGYKGGFLSGANQFTGYWTPVQGAVPAAELYGCYYCWWGPIQGSDDPADWFQAMIATTKAKHDDWAERLNNTGPIAGWLGGLIVFNGISKAVQEVGADRIDGDALKAAFDGLELELAGVGSALRFTENNNCGLTDHVIAEWDVASARWKDSNGEWYAPISLPE